MVSVSAQYRDAEDESVIALSESALFNGYQQAFQEATGLPMTLHAGSDLSHPFGHHPKSNSFCLLMAGTSRSCRACLELQAKLEREAEMAPKTLKCFAGLCDTAVPVRVHGKTLAFLKTGQVFLNQPDRPMFTRTAERLLAWGAKVDLKALEESYFQVKVLSEQQYQAFVALLKTFAAHLEILAVELDKMQVQQAPDAVRDAKAYIDEHYQDPLSLDIVAQTVNTSANYFCKLFKEATGMTFVQYLTHMRVEKAKHLLQNPKMRVVDVAFDVGFESLSQFNRSFKSIVGESPSAFRKAKNF